MVTLLPLAVLFITAQSPTLAYRASASSIFDIDGQCVADSVPLADGWPSVIDLAAVGAQGHFVGAPSWGAATPVVSDEIGMCAVVGNERRGPGHAAAQRTYFDDAGMGRGKVVDILFYSQPDVFYILRDCMMGHSDAPQGPFFGDPREVLAPHR